MFILHVLNSILKLESMCQTFSILFSVPSYSKVKIDCGVVVYVPMQCMAVITFGSEVGCMISEGPWVFVGIPNIVKVTIRTHNPVCTLENL